MNCSNSRQRILALAANSLEPEKKRDLQAHLRTCAACRAYFEQISLVTEKLRAVEIRPDIHSPESFHRKLASRLRTERFEPFWMSALSDLRSLLMSNARTAVGTAIVFIAALGLLHFWTTTPPVKGIPAIAVSPAPSAKPEVAPSVSNYQVVVNRSFEQLDELLTDQGTRTSPSPPIYTASTLSLAKDLE